MAMTWANRIAASSVDRLTWDTSNVWMVSCTGSCTSRDIGEHPICKPHVRGHLNRQMFWPSHILKSDLTRRMCPKLVVLETCDPPTRVSAHCPVPRRRTSKRGLCTSLAGLPRTSAKSSIGSPNIFRLSHGEASPRVMNVADQLVQMLQMQQQLLSAIGALAVGSIRGEDMERGREKNIAYGFL